MSIGNLDAALRGSSRRPAADVASTIDELVRQSIDYRSSAAFKEMIEFMAKFRAYAPYNNMLVRIQKPSCSFYATEIDWGSRFERHLKEDARPLLILMPFGPVMLVYDLDQTDGRDVPRELPYGPAANDRPHQRPNRCQHLTTRDTDLKISLAPTEASTDVKRARD